MKNVFVVLFTILFFYKFFKLPLQVIFVKGMKRFLRKGYAEAAEKVELILLNDYEFLNNAVEVIKSERKFRYETALKFFFRGPHVIDTARDVLRQRRAEYKAKGDVTMLIWEQIVETLADRFLKSWKKPEVKNVLVDKIRSML